MGTPERRKALLDNLVNAGIMRQAPTVPYLQPYEDNAWIPSVQSLQQRYFRVPSAVAARKVFGPCSFAYPSSDGGPPSEMGIELSISQAPAAFAIPTHPHQTFALPFKVSLRLSAVCPGTFPAAVRASTLTAEEARSAAYWSPLPEGDPRLLCDAVASDVTLTDSGAALADGRRVYATTHDFLFLNLQLTAPSDGEPLFLAFHLDLPAPGVFYYTLLMIPTVVVHPGIPDAAAEAAALLWGGVLPSRPVAEPRWTFHDFCTHVTHELQVAVEIERGLSPMDLLVLAHRAGFFLSNRPSLSTPSVGTAPSTTSSSGWEWPRICGGPSTQMEVDSLREYVRCTQALLKLIRPHYERRAPQLICGFSVGRQEAAALLDGHPPGTFLLRFAYEAGSMAISVVQRSGEVGHLKVTYSQLQRASLAEILAVCSHAVFLLDPSSGLRFPRESVLDKGYVCDPRVVHLLRDKGRRFGAGSAPVASGLVEGGPVASESSGQSPAVGGCGVQAAEGDQLPDQGLVPAHDFNGMCPPAAITSLVCGPPGVGGSPAAAAAAAACRRPTSPPPSELLMMMMDSPMDGMMTDQNQLWPVPQ